MKRITTIILLAITVFILGSDYLNAQAAPCDSIMNYSPLNPEYTPVKYVRITLHVFQKTDGTGNFPDTPESRNWLLNRFVGSTNSRMANLHPMNLASPSPHITDSRIRYVVDTICFHQDDEGWDFYPKGNASHFSFGVPNALYKKYVTDNPEIRNTTNSIHVFLGACDKIRGMASGIGDVRWIAVAGVYDLYLDGENFWVPSGNLRHELGHSLGLVHTWNANDYCNDTPRNPGCWNGQNCSNNMMDYNASKAALTACQLARMHYYLSGNKGTVHQAVIKDYCQHDGSEVHIPRRESVEWNCTKFLKGDVVIEKNATLTIRCTVSVPEGATIRLQKGARLIIDGGKITNLCGNYWSGIQYYSRASRQLKLLNGGAIEMVQ